MSTAAPERTRPAPPAARTWAARLIGPLTLATLVGNVLIMVTGAAVRLSDSGLGCPTWPRCTDASYVNTPEYGVHGVIEFGNRLLGTVLGLVVAATILAVLLARPRRRSLLWLAGLQVAGVAAQIVVGGATVHSDLNPWVVGVHFLISVGMILGAYALWHRAGEGDAAPVAAVPGALRVLAVLLAVAALAVIVVGVTVTGSGPHAGDAGAARNGLDPATVSQVHADLVFLLVGLTLAAVFAFWGSGIRAPLALLAVELAQGTIGFVQYATDLPVLLVGAHVLGAAVLWVFAVRVWFTTRVRA